MRIHTLLNQFYQNPKKLFLIDGIGAIVSAVMLGIILVYLESWFGIPKKVLYVLAFFPCLFAAFDFLVYRYTKSKLSRYLIIIAYANLGYVGLSLSLAWYHLPKLTGLGWIYITCEVSIILLMVYIELATAHQIRRDYREE